MLRKHDKELETFHEVVTERNHLRNLHKDFEEWKERNEKDQRKLFADFLTTFNVQKENLKTAAITEREWESKYNELKENNDCISNKLKTQKCIENKLNEKVEESEKNMKCVQKELCNTKVK